MKLLKDVLYFPIRAIFIVAMMILSIFFLIGVMGLELIRKMIGL